MADLFGYEAPPAPPGMVEITCEWRSETAEAIAVVRRGRELRLDGGRETWTWLPLSQIADYRREARDTVTVVLLEELAREKGLL